MSIPITKAMAAKRPNSTDSANEVLPVIDLLSFCDQSKHFKRREEVPKSESSQNVSMFKASSFGIDGSFPPKISSWSRKTMLYRVPKASRTRWSRTKSECSMVREELQHLENPRSGYSSPCFQASITPVRCRHLSYTTTSPQIETSGVLGEQNFVISKANLNRRPNKKVINTKTDVNGNITSISESDPRSLTDLRRTIDLDASAQTRARPSVQERKEGPSKLWFFRTEGSHPDNYHNELFSSYNVMDDSERDNERDHKDSLPAAPVKRIDIKLPY